MRQGADRHALKDRGHDFYETPACAVRALLGTGELSRFAGGIIWEPCAGRGAISYELYRGGFNVKATDLIKYDNSFGVDGGYDFFCFTMNPGFSVIVTNPPFMHADRFVRHGLNLGLPMIVLLRLMALEGARRSDLIDGHLRRVWAGIERLPRMHREGWTGNRCSVSGAPFAWFVFEPTPRPVSEAIELRRISWRG